MNQQPEQFDADGYRPLDADEIKPRFNFHLEIEMEVYPRWIRGFTGADRSATYRTKLTRAELVKLN